MPIHQVPNQLPQAKPGLALYIALHGQAHLQVMPTMWSQAAADREALPDPFICFLKYFIEGCKVGRPIFMLLVLEKLKGLTIV